MALFFNKYPRVYYSLVNNVENILTNLTVRFAFEEKFKNNTSAYYKYNIQEEDTPEVLAYKIYGSAERHWLILLMNDIINPYYDWHLNYENFNRYIISKYNSTNYAQTNIHSYYKTIKTTISGQGMVSKVDTKKYQIDVNSYNALPVFELKPTITLPDGYSSATEITKSTLTYYDYEIEVNDNKRTIKLLKREFVEAAEKELRLILA